MPKQHHNCKQAEFSRKEAAGRVKAASLVLCNMQCFYVQTLALMHNRYVDSQEQPKEMHCMTRANLDYEEDKGHSLQQNWEEVWLGQLQVIVAVQQTPVPPWPSRWQIEASPISTYILESQFHRECLQWISESFRPLTNRHRNVYHTKIYMI